MSSFLTHHGVVYRARLRRRRCYVRRPHLARAARAVARQRNDAHDLGGGAGGRSRLPESPVHGDRRCRRAPVHRADPDPEHSCRDRLRHRRLPLGVRGIHRDERLGAGECPRGGVGPERRVARSGRGLPGRGGDGSARGRPRAAGCLRLLRRAHLDRRGDAGERGHRAGRPRLRWFADLGVRPSGRRHLHQGRRRWRRPGRQDRSRDPGGRSPQPRRDRRQRRRQRRRLRRDGGRPVRDLRRDRCRGHAARRPAVQAAVGRGPVPARARRGFDHRLDHRHVRGQVAGWERRARALPGSDRLRRARRARVPPDHLLDDARPHVQVWSPGSALVEVLPVLVDRDRRHRVPVRDHRLLHLDALCSGEEHRAGLADRARDEHHPGARTGPSVHRATGDRDRAGHLGLLEACRRRHHHRDLRHRRGRHGAALADRPDRRARRVRPDHRQRRRDRRDGRPSPGGPRRDRPARRGRQHDQGGHQGVRDRLGRTRGAGAVQRVRERADPEGKAPRLLDRQPRRADRLARRRADGLPVRLAGDGGGWAAPAARWSRRCAASSASTPGSWRAPSSPSTEPRWGW